MHAAPCSIRVASPSDRALVLYFHEQLYVQYRQRVVPSAERQMGDYRQLQEVLAEDVRSLLGRPGALVLLAEQGPERLPVGYLSAQFQVDTRRALPRRATIEDWYVEPSCRTQGIGTALFAEAEKRLRAQHCELIESATWPSNTPARRAHEHLGFLEVEIRYRKRLR